MNAQPIKRFFALFLIGFISFFASAAYADGMNGDGDWHMMGGGLMWLFWILVIGVIVFLLVNALKKQDSEPRETPLDILNTRYARGEISKEEYERMKRDIY